MRPRPTAIEIDSLTLRYGERLIQRDLSFTIAQGDIFIIMGGMKPLRAQRITYYKDKTFSGKYDRYQAG